MNFELKFLDANFVIELYQNTKIKCIFSLK